MKVRIGALEIEVDTKEQLDELVMRYGGAAVAVVDSPASRASSFAEAATDKSEDGKDTEKKTS
jgi:ribosomal protein L12E/L44/L45/RPP1/RPP2